MLELYSLNIEVPENGSIPLNNTKIIKGCTAVHSAPATINLNKSGVYRVACNASITPTAAGDVSLQLYQDGSPVINAVSSFTGAADTTNTANFETLVQVRYNNSNCNCFSSPTALQLVNTGIAATYDNINVVITKLC